MKGRAREPGEAKGDVRASPRAKPAVPGSLATSNSARLAALDLEDTVDLAEASLHDATSPLPHREQIQAAFGGYDLGTVRTLVGGNAARLAAAMGANAYAVGNRIGFRDLPDLDLAAHEAAHVVQQRERTPRSGCVAIATSAPPIAPRTR
jgi:hypothetical protein